MTESELEKEIKNYIDKNCKQWETDGLTVDDIVRVAVLDFAEPREKQIEELEAENAELRNNGFTVSAITEQQLKVALEKGEQLEKENAELKEKLEITDLALDNCLKDGEVENDRNN